MAWQHYGSGPFQAERAEMRRWAWQLQPAEERTRFLFAHYNDWLDLREFGFLPGWR